MKTLLYIVFAFVICIIISGFRVKENVSGKTIVLQAKIENPTMDDLSESVKILKNRLNTFGFEKSEITLLKDKKQIIVKLSNNSNIEFIHKLLIQKGAVSFMNGNKEELASGTDIESIRSVPSATSKDFEISIKFRNSSIAKWAKATGMNINKQIAFMLDNTIIYNPVLKSEITNGTCVIAGNFTEIEANFIAAIGSNEVLPIELEIVQ